MLVTPASRPCWRPPASILSAMTRVVRWQRGVRWYLRSAASPEPPPETSTASLTGSSVEPVLGSTKPPLMVSRRVARA